MITPSISVFISYDSSDRQWALWLSGSLKKIGYNVTLGVQFQPASSLVQELLTAVNTANQTIIVLSPAYLRVLRTQPEAKRDLAGLLEGQSSKIVPVRARKCELEEPLASIAFIDLVGLEEDDALVQLLDGLSKARSQQTEVHPLPFPGNTGSQAVLDEKVRFPPHAPILQYGIPPRNTSFVRRDDLLHDLYVAFHKEASGLAHPQGLCGIGGIGKTQIAIEYAHHHRESYQAIFHINVGTPEELNKDVMSIAALLYPEERFSNFNQAISQVMSWLETREYWLLILSDMNDPAMVHKYLPRKGRGHILLTTCSQATGALVNPIQVKPMSREEGALLLLQRAKILKLHQTLEYASPDDRQVAERISEAMHGLPLALDQAGAYIEGSGLGLEEYEQLFRDFPATCLKRRGLYPLDHESSVADTWWRSFERLKQANHAAAELLLFCAFLGPHPIPERMIRDAAAFLSSDFQILSKELFRWWETIAELRKHSFVERDSANKLLVVYPLLSIVLKDRLEEREHQRWEEHVVRAVHAALTSKELSPFEIESCHIHARHCIQYIVQRGMNLHEALDLLKWFSP